MTAIGRPGNPLRVAVIGAGPAGFYIISNLAKQKELSAEIDLFDRLPTPYGLVRAGVAPDHQKDKSVTRVYDKSANMGNVRFYGGVEYGRHVSLSDLKRFYHQVVFTTGASRDRNLNLPGEELEGSHSATDFVAWYNGHPDFVDLEFDLSQEAVAIIGIGNVAIDVARILCKSADELAATDMADHAIDALRASRVKDVYLLGRRGPGQAAFTPPEIREMGELEDVDLIIRDEDAAIDALTQAWLEGSKDRNATKNIDYIKTYHNRPLAGKARRLHLYFWTSPTELVGDAEGRLKSLHLVRNEPVAGSDGSVRSRATDKTEEISAGLAFRSVGYRGLALPDVPFHEDWGTIRNQDGRIVDGEDGELPGLYAAGWIKRGPTGVIGTNKTCAQGTVACMMEDLAGGRLFAPAEPAPDAARQFLLARAPDAIDYQDWMRIGAAEEAKGEAAGRPRVKFTRVPDMLQAAKG